MRRLSFRNWLRPNPADPSKLRRRGALSIETILIIGAIAVPILIFILKFGWPKIRNYFMDSTDTLIQDSYNAQQQGGGAAGGGGVGGGGGSGK